MKWTTYTVEQQNTIRELVVAVYHEFFYNRIYLDNWEELALELVEIIKSNPAKAALVNQHYGTDFAKVKRFGNSEIRYREEKLK